MNKGLMLGCLYMNLGWLGWVSLIYLKIKVVFLSKSPSFNMLIYNTFQGLKMIKC